jgi:hypothetical protein
MKAKIAYHWSDKVPEEQSQINLLGKEEDKRETEKEGEGRAREREKEE